MSSVSNVSNLITYKECSERMDKLEDRLAIGESRFAVIETKLNFIIAIGGMIAVALTGNIVARFF